MRFNDLAFAAHAVVMSLVAYSQFWGVLWGFKVGEGQRVSRPVAGIFFGSLIAVIVVVLTVLTKGRDGGSDAYGWAWIDVVSGQRGVFLLSWYLSNSELDIRHRLREARGYLREVHPTSLGELQETVYGWLEHLSDLVGHQWRRFVYSTARS